MAKKRPLIPCMILWRLFIFTVTCAAAGRYTTHTSSPSGRRLCLAFFCWCVETPRNWTAKRLSAFGEQPMALSEECQLQSTEGNGRGVVSRGPETKYKFIPRSCVGHPYWRLGLYWGMRTFWLGVTPLLCCSCWPHLAPQVWLLWAGGGGGGSSYGCWQP